MTQQEFRTQCYAILEKRGHIERNGELYYPESSIMDLIEFLRENKITFEMDQLEGVTEKLMTRIKAAIGK